LIPHDGLWREAAVCLFVERIKLVRRFLGKSNCEEDNPGRENLHK